MEGGEMHRVRVSAVAASFGRDVSEGIGLIRRIVETAQSQGADLVVLPECAIGGYLDPTSADPEPPYLDRDGPEVASLMRMAGPTTICVGYSERGPGGPFSSAICLSGDGVHGHYRKVHLPPGEKGHYREGNSLSAFDTPVGRLGMLLCYDKIFPESASCLALDGARIIAVMSAWPISRDRPAETVSGDRQTRAFNVLDQSRAVDNQVGWVSSNQTGTFAGLRFLGNAKVVDPEGAILAQTSHRAGLATATLDLHALEGLRRQISHLGDRRPEVYAQAA